MQNLVASEKWQETQPETKSNISFLMMGTSSIAGPDSGFSPIITVSSPFCSPPLQHSPPSANSTPGNQSNDSAYHSDMSTPSPVAKTATPTKGPRLFSADVIRVLDHWYHQHFDHPYPTLHDVHELARKCNLRPDQVRKWLANKRNRSHNTLTYNGNAHPKSAKKLQQKQHRSSILTSPYMYRVVPSTVPSPSYPWVQMPFPIPTYPLQQANINATYATKFGDASFNHHNYINQIALVKPIHQNVESFPL